MDLQKLKSFLNGNLDLFHEFYEETKKEIFYNILAVVQDNHFAEDILQETYVKFLEKLPRIKLSNNPMGYLFKISRNLALDFVKTNKKDKSVSFEEMDYIHHSYDDHSQNHNLISEAKKILNEQEYEIVILHAVNDLTHKEISRITKKPIGTITWAYNNAIKKLQKGLAHYG